MSCGVKTKEASAEREQLILEHLPQVRLIARRIHERLPDSVSARGPGVDRGLSG